MVWSAGMRLGILAAWGLVCAVAPSSSGCTRALDFDALDGDGEVTRDVVLDGGVDVPATGRPGEGLDGGFSCRLITPAPTFCDDFDTRPLGDVWSAILAAPADGGTLAQDSRDSTSRPNSLLVTVAKDIPAKTYVGIGLHQPLPALSAKGGEIAVEFDMKVEASDPKPGRDVVAFQIIFGSSAAGSQRNQLVLNVQSAGVNQLLARFNDNVLTSTGEIVDSVRGDLLEQPAIDRWTHVAFTLQAGAPPDGKNQVVLRMGPRETFATKHVTLVSGPLRHDLQAGQPQMEVGIPWLSTDEATAAWQIRYDNVLVVTRQE